MCDFVKKNDGEIRFGMWSWECKCVVVVVLLLLLLQSCSPVSPVSNTGSFCCTHAHAASISLNARAV